MANLQDIITSKVRVKVLEHFFRNPGDQHYVRSLTRDLDEEINAIRRELTRFSKAGLLTEEKRGNRLYYLLNTQYPFYPELLRLVAKTTGLGLALRKQRREIGNPRFITFSMRFTQHKARLTPESIDVLLVGDIKMQPLTPLFKAEEELRGQEINFTIMTVEEFEFRKTRRDPFINEVLAGGLVMVIGDEDALVRRRPEV